MFSQPQIAKLLLNRGANVSARANGHQIRMALRAWDHLYMFERLYLGRNYERDMTPLHLAMLSTSESVQEYCCHFLAPCCKMTREEKRNLGLESLRFLLDDGVNADINARTEFGCTPLMLASSSGTDESVQELIKKGAAINVKGYGRECYSALQNAVRANRSNITMELLKNMNLTGLKFHVYDEWRIELQEQVSTFSGFVYFKIYSEYIR